MVQANKHVVELQQRIIHITQRNAMRESIREKLNAVGKTKRKTNEIKRRCQDIRRTNEKFIIIKPGGGGGGGGRDV